MGDFFKKIFGLVSGHKAVSGVAFAYDGGRLSVTIEAIE